MDSRSDSHQGTGDERSDDSGRLKKGNHQWNWMVKYEGVTIIMHFVVAPSPSEQDRSWCCIMRLVNTPIRF